MEDELKLINRFLVFVIFGATLLAVGVGNANSKVINNHKVAITVDGVSYAVENGIVINLSEELKKEDQEREDLRDGVDDTTREDGAVESESL
ncbi:sura N-terminal domain [Caudoviricetes sp.]|nr:sura N-terminal domain [Caudoviricetes sp.]